MLPPRCLRCAGDTGGLRWAGDCGTLRPAGAGEAARLAGDEVRASGDGRLRLGVAPTCCLPPIGLGEAAEDAPPAWLERKRLPPAGLPPSMPLLEL